MRKCKDIIDSNDMSQWKGTYRSVLCSMSFIICGAAIQEDACP